MTERWRAWRTTPRQPLLAARRHHVFVLILTISGWVATVQGTAAVLTGGADPSGGRGLAAVVYTLVWLAVTVALSWFVQAYVRRPVDPPPAEVEPVTDADRVRAANERAAWRSR